jgi:multiple antibiotic resistance protein
MNLFSFNDYLKIFAGILSIVNPLGAIPLYLTSTKNKTIHFKKRIANVSALTVGTTLLLAAWLGQLILAFFGIGVPAFRVGGGILILMKAISMMNVKDPGLLLSHHEDEEGETREEVGVVPIGIPLMAGPGAITLAIVEAHQHPGLLNMGMLSLIILGVALLVWVIFRLTARFGNKLSQTEINIATKLMGLILAAIAIEFMAKGLIELFPGLGRAI